MEKFSIKITKTILNIFFFFQGDSGGPVLDENNVLLGVIHSTSPNETLQWGYFETKFINKYKINLHASIDYYRDFIESVTNLLTKVREIQQFESDQYWYEHFSGRAYDERKV